MTVRRVGRRQLQYLKSQLSERDHTILRSVSELRLLTAQQIQQLHFSSGHATDLTAARTSRRVLERLAREHLLVRLQRRIGGVHAGSAGYIYVIGPVGQRIVEPHQTRRRAYEPGMAFVNHTLAIADLVVQLHVAAQQDRCDVIEVQTEPRCWRRLHDFTGERLRPDLFVRMGVGEYEYVSFVEVDLGTEAMPRLLRKCQTYQRYYESSREQQTHGVFPRVVWLLSDALRAKRLRADIEKAARLEGALFTVVTNGDPVASLSSGEAEVTTQKGVVE